MQTDNKLRKTVKELLDAMYDMGIDEETVSIAAESPNCHMHSAELLSVIKKAKAALAAPPRNCDRFDDLKSAQRHYIEHGCQKGLGMLVDGEIRKFPWKSQFEKWLFAPATEQKGETDGSK